MLRDLIAHPTIFVSKEQATITLARYLAPKKPAEARKLLDPLRAEPGIGRPGRALALRRTAAAVAGRLCWRACGFRWNEAGAGHIPNRTIPIAMRSSGTATG